MGATPSKTTSIKFYKMKRTVCVDETVSKKAAFRGLVIFILVKSVGVNVSRTRSHMIHNFRVTSMLAGADKEAL